MVAARALAAVLCCLAAAPASAAVITLDFTSTGTPSFTSSSPTFSDTQYVLDNTATGDSTIPTFSLSTGDELTGSITFAQPISSLAGTKSGAVGAQFTLDPGASSLTSFQYANPQVSFLLNGMDVTPAGGHQIGAASNFLVFGIGQKGPVAPFSFDKIVYDLVFSGLGNANGDAVTSGTVSSSLTRLNITSVSVVPEPGAWMMMIAGFAFVGCALRGSRPIRAQARARRA